MSFFKNILNKVEVFGGALRCFFVELNWRVFFKKSCSFLLCLVIVVPMILPPDDAYALNEGVRDTSWKYNERQCDFSTLKYDPLVNNDDITWEISNPVCISYMATSGLLVKAAGVTASYFCLDPAAAAEEVLSAAEGVPISPAMAKRNAKKSAKCASLWATQNYAQATLCCAGIAASGIAIGIAMSALAIIYALAKDTFENAQICGGDWQTWAKIDPATGNEVSEAQVAILQENKGLGNLIWKRGRYTGSYRKCLEDMFLRGDNSCGLRNVDNINAMSVSIKNQYYREYIYGGKEIADKGGGSCDNPADWSDATKLRILGYTDSKQRYYMTGPAAAPVYACQRFLMADPSNTTSIKAYDCCKKRSQSTICIENRVVGDSDRSFCTMGSRCSVSGIFFDIYPSKSQMNYICAKTFSVCPYNHLLGGGTEIKDEVVFNGMAQVKNFCQFMNHCSKLPIMPYVATSDFDGGFISSACRDMKGDSQNSYGYDIDILPSSMRVFSAPMAQCFKETMENVFMNKAGYTECFNPDEKPVNGVCLSGKYRYRKGHDLPTKSFFLKIQDNLRMAIKLALSFSVMFLGFGILYGKVNIADKKQLLMYVVKICFVMYFAIGDGWQNGMMTGVLRSSDFLANFMFRGEALGDPFVNNTTDCPPKSDNKLDGCQFPRFNYSSTANDDTRYCYATYPPGKEYLRIWDTFDCKIARALGFGPEVAVPNLIMMILGGFLTGGLGIVFIVGAFFFAFCLISIVVRALHIFLMSVTAMVILFYLSPVTITLAMFDRTKGVFDGWLKQILGFALQPMILFLYLGIFLSFFDHVIIGDVTFKGDGRSAPKQIVCSGEAEKTSIYCIFRIADLKTFDGLNVIGIGLPILTSMTKEKLQTVVKSAFLLFIFMKFLDQITSFATNLVGGKELRSEGISAVSMASKMGGALGAIQKRGMQGLTKHGVNLAEGSANKAKSAYRTLTTRRKKIAAPRPAPKGGDMVVGSGGRGGDRIPKPPVASAGPVQGNGGGGSPDRVTGSDDS